METAHYRRAYRAFLQQTDRKVFSSECIALFPYVPQKQKCATSNGYGRSGIAVLVLDRSWLWEYSIDYRQRDGATQPCCHSCHTPVHVDTTADRDLELPKGANASFEFVFWPFG